MMLHLRSLINLDRVLLVLLTVCMPVGLKFPISDQMGRVSLENIYWSIYCVYVRVHESMIVLQVNVRLLF